MKRIGLLITVLTITLVAFAWGWVPVNSASYDCRYQTNAAWISVDWTAKPVQKDTIAQLAAEAKNHRFKYLYPYVSYLKKDGSFSQSYRYAADFVTEFRQVATDEEVFAWVGIPLSDYAGLGVPGWADLHNEQTRQQIVDFINTLLRDASFDGVHINAETVWSGDENFLALLDEVRAALGKKYKISIAGSQWMPPFLRWLPGIGKFRWDDHYYQAVAHRVDQIAVMTYDSHLPLGALYRLWLREEVKGIERSLATLETELLYGISVSREHSTSRNPAVETIGNGLSGICAGLQAANRQPIQTGIAIYAAWEMQGEDSAHLQGWLNQ